MSPWAVAAGFQFFGQCCKFFGLVAVGAEHGAHRLEGLDDLLEGLLAMFHRLSRPGVLDFAAGGQGKQYEQETESGFWHRASVGW
jgi:hypothetical protein